MRYTFAILISVFLFTIAIHTTICVQAESEVTIYIDGSGVATVTLFIEATQGMNTVNLPVEPLEPTIEVVCNDLEVPWLLTDVVELHFYVESACGVVVSYVANISIEGGVFTVDVANVASAKLVLDSNIVLLTLPQNITDIHKEDSGLAITFAGPAEISYTVLQSISQPSTTPATKSPTTIPITTTIATKHFPTTIIYPSIATSATESTTTSATTVQTTATTTMTGTPIEQPASKTMSHTVQLPTTVAKESTIEVATQSTTVGKALPIALPQLTVVTVVGIAIAVAVLLLKCRGLG